MSGIKRKGRKKKAKAKQKKGATVATQEVTRIDQLTDEQRAAMPAWRDMWIASGLKTGETDWAEWEIGARGCYKAADIRFPENVIRVDSPLVGALAAPISASLIHIYREALKGEGKKETLHEIVKAAAGEDIAQAIVTTTVEVVTQAVVASLKDFPDLNKGVLAATRQAVGTAMAETLRLAIHSFGSGASFTESERPFAEPINDAVNFPVDHRIRQHLSEAVAQASKNSKLIWWHDWMGGQFWSAWAAYESFFRRVCHLKLPGPIMAAAEAYERTAKSAAYWWPNRDFVMVCARPVAIHRNATGQLHADGRMAIEWPDGYGLYMLNGVNCGKTIVMSKAEEIDPKLVVTEKNAEIRREVVRKVGVERICAALGSEVMDTWEDYELLSLDLQDGRKRPYLKMKNPSIGTYHVEGVHPDCTTVKEALKWRNGTEELPAVLT